MRALKILSVVGARPQFVKLGPIARELSGRPGVEHVIVHTGQHYDELMSDVFFRDLGIPAPNIHLNVGSASHGVQTGQILSSLEPVLVDQHPDWTLVYGDTNSTLAAAMAAVKLHLPLAHLEAGLRSFNRRMPEEHNRVLTDHAADLLFAPTKGALVNLEKEGLLSRAILIGDVMVDLCFMTREAVRDSAVKLPEGVAGESPYLIATLHRPDNTDSEGRLREIVEALRSLDLPVVLLAHPRLVARAKSFGIGLSGGSLHSCAPLAYPQMIRALMSSSGVITDSGGLQKEAFLLAVPCTTLRTETEWVETLENGWNILDPDLADLQHNTQRKAPIEVQSQPFGSGDAARKVADVLISQAVSITNCWSVQQTNE